MDLFGQFLGFQTTFPMPRTFQMISFAYEMAHNFDLSCAYSEAYAKLIENQLLTNVFEISLAQVPKWTHNGTTLGWTLLQHSGDIQYEQ